MDTSPECLCTPHNPLHGCCPWLWIFTNEQRGLRKILRAIRIKRRARRRFIRAWARRYRKPITRAE